MSEEIDVYEVLNDLAETDDYLDDTLRKRDLAGKDLTLMMWDFLGDNIEEQLAEDYANGIEDIKRQLSSDDWTNYFRSHSLISDEELDVLLASVPAITPDDDFSAFMAEEPIEAWSEEQIINHIEARYGDYFLFPIVFESMMDERNVVAVNFDPIYKDCIAWCDFENYMELTPNYCKESVDAYMEKMISTSMDYDFYISKYKEEFFDKYFVYVEDCDPRNDRLGLYGLNANEAFDYDNPPKRYLYENAENGFLDEVAALKVRKIPDIEDVYKIFKDVPIVSNRYSNYPYCLAGNEFCFFDPTVVEDGYSLMDGIAWQHYGYSINGLLVEAINEPDPAEYVAYQLAMPLLQGWVAKYPYITVSGIFDGIANFRYKRKQKRIEQNRRTIWDDLLGRQY